MMTAVSAAKAGADVTVFEKGDRLGRKLRITGKGRCNVTNDCDFEEFLSNVPKNPRFLYAALHRFGTDDTKKFFEDAGVPLKTERGKRVFPVSDHASDIVEALKRECGKNGCRIIHERVNHITVKDGCTAGVETRSGRTDFDAVILCTGGLSYPTTGSDGDGYRMAKELGHTVTETIPSLVPIAEDGHICASMQGLSLKNVKLIIKSNANGKNVYEDFGEMMFTHFGLTGPLVLSASAHLHDLSKGKYTAVIDLKPALDEKTLDTRIISDFGKYNNRDFINSLDALLPQKMIETVVRLSGIDPRKKVNSITKEERKKLVALLKHFEIPLLRFRPIDEAIVTSGGIDVKEINPKTMESKLVHGLYFAGEIIDTDAYTGGFNLQIAFSTAVLAGESAAKSMNTEKKGMDTKMIRIAIDGPSGSGKSTVAKAVAAKLGIVYVDTGALYRSIGYYVCSKGIDKNDKEKIIASLPEIKLDVKYENGTQCVYLCGENLGDKIRTPEISMYASAVSAIPEVRAFLLDTQKSIAAKNSVIMDGRDIGTVILPDADVKIFMTASNEARAMRRTKELLEKGTEVRYEDVLADMIQRDANDRNREIAPAVPADDAIIFDNSEYDLEGSVKHVLDLIKEKTEAKI